MKLNCFCNVSLNWECCNHNSKEAILIRVGGSFYIQNKVELGLGNMQKIKKNAAKVQF